MKTLLKIFLPTIVLVCISCMKPQPINPIYNTDWAGIANIPTAENVIIRFIGDHINVLVKDEIVEQMKFQVTNDTLQIEKIMGGSPCPVTSKGVYRYEIKNDRLSIKYISDECDSRQYNMTVSDFKKLPSKSQ